MSQIQQWWKANSHDWIFCRTYSYYRYVDGGVNPFRFPLTRSLFWKWTLQSGVVTAICLITMSFMAEGSIWRQLLGLLVVLAIISLPFRIIYYSISYAFRLERTTHYPAEREEVDYALVTNNGIFLNWLNNHDTDGVPFIQWTRIRKIELILTEHPRRVQQGQHPTDYMKQTINTFDQIRSRYPRFPYHAERIYSDRLSLLLHHHPAFLSQIPLPPKWDSTMINAFLKEVQQSSGIQIDLYEYGGSDRADSFNRLLLKKQITIN